MEMKKSLKEKGIRFVVPDNDHLVKNVDIIPEL